MTVLEQILNLVPLAVAKAVTEDARNVVRFPAGPPPSVVDGPLDHDTGGLPDTRAQRVVVLLGPGATLLGVADTLLPLYTGADQPTAEELAKALYVYNQAYLPAGTGQVGLVLPLPVEVSASGSWTVNVAKVHAGAAQFPGRALATLGEPARPLPLPDAAELDADAVGTAAAQPPGILGPQLWTRALRNPFEAVLPFLATLRALDAPGALATTLAALGEATPGQAALLAANRAGGAILRALSRILAAAPAGTGAAARTLVDTATHAQPAPPDLPETATQRRERKGAVQPAEGAATEPAGGIHRTVLGRDVAVGRAAPLRIGGTSTTGPDFAGRVALRAYLAADAAHLNPAGDGRIGASLNLLAGQAPDLARLDAVRAGGPGALAAGIGRWTAGELATVLNGYKLLSPDEFTLFFLLAGLDVDQDPADAGRHRLLRVGPTGATTVLDGAALTEFFGGTAGAGGSVTYTSDWAARFRLPAVVSSWYRRAQVAHAAAGTAATATPIELLAATIGPFPDHPYTLSLDATRSGNLQTLLTDLLGSPTEPATVIGQIKAAGAQSAGTIAAALVDLTLGPAAAAYAGYFDEETYNIGSMGKVAPLYAVHELRHRATRLIAAVKAAQLNTGDWVQQVRNAMYKVWGRQICTGFPGLDTHFPGRAPRWDTVLTISPTGDVSLASNGATVTQMAAVGEFGRAQALGDMKFREWLWITIHFSNNYTASLVIDALQYPYINGALARGGFFDPATNKGIWISGDYDGRDWTRDDYLTLSPRGQAHYKQKSQFVGNGKQFARLLTLAVTHKLFDPDTTMGDDMLDFMIKRTVPNENGSFIADSVDGVDTVRSKIGIGVAPTTPPSHPAGICDCAIIDRHAGTAPIRYVAVVTGGYVPAAEINAFRKVVSDGLDFAILAIQS